MYIQASQTLGITSLLGLCARKFTEEISRLIDIRIRAKFNIQKDFTAEKKEEIRRENQWKF